MSFRVGISSPRIFSLVSLSAFGFLLTGCTLATTAPDAPIAGTPLQGKVFGGNQPVVGAHVYLMAATVSGVGAAGYGLASTSLLGAATTGHSDSVGAYVLTDSNGNFRLDAGSGSLSYDYTCPSATTQVYLYALGGNPGAGTNNAASFMAALGSCGSLNSSQTVQVNELTTVASAYALAGFATDALHVSIPQYASAATQLTNTTDALAATDLQNAFATAANLVSTTTGAALTTTPGGNGTPNSAQVITLGNILAACINSNGATTNPSNCYTLLNNAGSTGGPTGIIPSDTATAAINIAHYPYVSSAVMGNLFGLQSASGAPFAGGDSSQPTDFTLSITFTGGGLNRPYSIAIDGLGNVWTANNSGNTLSKFSPSGTAISSSSGYTGGGLNSPQGIAIDASGNAWTANINANSISEFSSSGTAISTSSGYTGGGLNSPRGIAIDNLGNAWIVNANNNSISTFSSSGTALSSSSGYTGGGLNQPDSIAIDASGNAWAANYSSSSSLSRFSASGSALSSSSGYTGGGLNYPEGIAIDNSGNAWVANINANSISKFSSTGTAISTSSGYTGGGLNSPNSLAIDGSGNAWMTNSFSNPVSRFSSSGTAISPSSGYTGGGLIISYSIAIDGSGDVWVATPGNNTLTELVGAATPVVTPLVANLITPYTAPASRP